MNAALGTPIDLPENIVRMGEEYKPTLKLANHAKIVDIAINEGFNLEKVIIRRQDGTERTFTGAGIAVEAETEEAQALPKNQLRNVRVLNVDTIQLVVHNVGDDDSLFQGVMYIQNAPVIGEARPAATANAAARAGAPLAPVHRPAPRPQAMPAPASAKLTPRTLVPKHITPGPNEVVCLLSRRQAELVLRFAQGKFVAPVERQQLFGPIRRALHMITHDELAAEQAASGDDALMQAEA